MHIAQFGFRTLIQMIFAMTAIGAGGYSSALADRYPAAAATPEFKLSYPELSANLGEAVKRVTEFKEIGEWGTARGVRVYLAGGTAAGLAIY